jgi:two-component system sensor histidine kinase KdpD
MARGTLRIYLGAAPGVGKTFAMLGEGRRRAGRGTDVVVGFVETHGRQLTADQIADLEVVPRRCIEYKGATFEEMDVDAVLTRRPEVVLVDELAHTNVPGSRNEKRWQDVEELLEAGITVVSTLNVQHMESVNDVVEQVTGIRQRETIPDEVVRRADQVELVDMTPEAIRRRMAHGNIYPAERIDAALANYFREGNLGALRELALMWMANQVDEGLARYREREGIEQPWETRERVLVGLVGAESEEHLIRRAARMATRMKAELVAVHVQHQDDLTIGSEELLDRQRRLVAGLGGTYREVVAADIGEALLETARGLNATQVVLGASRHSRWAELLRGSVVHKVIRDSGVGIDVHVISRPEADREPARVPGPPRRRFGSLPRRRVQLGLAVAVLGGPLLTAALAGLRDELTLSTILLLYLLYVVAASAIGGLWAALVAAFGGFLLANYYFTDPLYSFHITEGETLLSLCVFLAVAFVVSGYVAAAARRAAEGARARAEAEALARLAGSSAVADVLDNLRRVFDADGAAILHRQDGGGWQVEVSAGEHVPSTPGDGTAEVPIGDRHLLVIAGGSIEAHDRPILDAYAAEIGASLELEELEAEAGEADRLAAANELRTAILSAVSHDLRTPLSAIKASVTSLLQQDVNWKEEETQEFLETIDEETDRLDALVGNLLDMSRLQSGALEIQKHPVGLEEAIGRAFGAIGERASAVELDVPESLPRVNADAGLLERVLANVIDNAIAHSPPGKAVRVLAGAIDGWIDVRVVDRGPGVPPIERDRMFAPFQRLGDSSVREGVGLGLAVSKGFVEAMGGVVEVEDTPGGGLTMVLRLRAAE